MLPWNKITKKFNKISYLMITKIYNYKKKVYQEICPDFDWLNQIAFQSVPVLCFWISNCNFLCQTHKIDSMHIKLSSSSSLPDISLPRVSPQQPVLNCPHQWASSAFHQVVVSPWGVGLPTLPHSVRSRASKMWRHRPSFLRAIYPTHCHLSSACF